MDNTTPNPEESRRRELDRALRLLRGGKDPALVAQALAQRLTAKLLHAPLKAMTA